MRKEVALALGTLALVAFSGLGYASMWVDLASYSLETQAAAAVLAMPAKRPVIEFAQGQNQCTFNRDLHFPLSGPDVAILKRYLSSKGHLPGQANNTVERGEVGYTKEVAAAVVKLQISEGKVATGIFSKEDTAVLRDLCLTIPQATSTRPVGTTTPQINATSTLSQIVVRSPQASTTWIVGRTYEISYSASRNVGQVRIMLNRYSDNESLLSSELISTTEARSIRYTVPSGTVTTSGLNNRYKIEVYPPNARELVARSEFFSVREDR